MLLINHEPPRFRTHREFEAARKYRNRTMNEKDRKAVTQLPPPPDTPSDVAAAASTIPPAEGVPPAELAPESDHTLRAEPDRYASPELERLSVQKLLDMHTKVEGWMHEMLDPSGKLESNRVQTVSDIAIVVDNGLKRMATAFESRFTGIEAKISKQGDTILALELKVGAFEKQLAEMRTELDELKKGQPGGSAEAAPAAATTA